MAELPRKDKVRVRDLAMGARFGQDGQCWTVSYVSNLRIEARESQFSTIRTFCDR